MIVALYYPTHLKNTKCRACVNCNEDNVYIYKGGMNLGDGQWKNQVYFYFKDQFIEIYLTS